MIQVNMDRDVLLILVVVLVTNIAAINGVRYEVIDNQTTWKEAANACDHLNGTLIDSSEYYDNAINITLTDNSSYWTSNFSFLTQWVELKGCFTIRDQNVTALCWQYGQTNTDVGWLCYAFCQAYTYFGITEGVCVCFSENPAPPQSGSFSNCPACSNHSKYQCGTEGYTAVYQKQNKTQSEKKELCLSYNCHPVNTGFGFGFKVQLCKGRLRAKCSDNSNTSNTSWMRARRECEARNSLLLRHPIAECAINPSTSPFWDNVHKDIAWLTTGIELPASLRIHTQYELKDCSSITNGNYTPRFVDCESHTLGYICKIENNTEVFTASICNISELTTMVFTQTTKDKTTPLEKDYSNSELTTIPHIDQRVENSTEAEDMDTYIAIGAGAGGFLVVILVVIAVICLCRKRSHKSNADETEGDYKNEIDVDDGEMNHITAAERYITIKSEQVSVKYTVENGKAATKTSEPGKSWGGGYEQIVLPNEEPDSGFLDQDSIVDHVKQTQPSPDIHETPNAIQYTEEEDDYAEVDSESVTEENIPEICIKSASIKKAETNDEQEAEDDYDHFGQPDQRQSVSSNYDHVHLRNSRKSKKGNNQDDSEDYDHIPGAGGRQEETEVDSTYDHTQIFGLRESTASVSSNYDHVVLLKNQCGQEDALNRISDDYDHTSNVSKVKVADGDRDSNYTQVILPDSP